MKWDEVEQVVLAGKGGTGTAATTSLRITRVSWSRRILRMDRADVRKE